MATQTSGWLGSVLVNSAVSNFILLQYELVTEDAAWRLFAVIKDFFWILAANNRGVGQVLEAIFFLQFKHGFHLSIVIFHNDEGDLLCGKHLCSLPGLHLLAECLAGAIEGVEEE